MGHRFIVGNENCAFNKITTAMNQAATVDTIMTKWMQIAKGLGVGSEVIHKIERKISHEHWTADLIMDEILRSWRAMASTDATLDVLLGLLDDNKLKDVANEIRLTFGVSTYSRVSKSRNAPQQASVQPKVTSDNLHEHFFRNAISMMPFGHPANFDDDNDPFDTMPTQNTFINKPKIEMKPKPAISLHSSRFLDRDSSVSGSKIVDGPNSNQNSLKDDWDSREFQPGQYTTVSVKLGKPEDRDDDDYKLPGVQKGNGYALILNIIKYQKQGYRQGAQYNSFMLTQLFTQLGYKTIKYDDPNTIYTKDDLERIVKRFRDYVQPKNPASVVVFIGCHGHLEEIQLSDETFTSLFSSVVDQFNTRNCSKLEAVPKMFFIESLPDVGTCDGTSVGDISNAILCCAALPENKQIMDEESGNHYIKSLVKVFAEKANRLSLTDLLDFVDGQFSKELKKYGIKSDDRPDSMYMKLGGFDTLYFNV